MQSERKRTSRLGRVFVASSLSKRKQRTDLQAITNIRTLLMFTKLEKFSKQDYLFFC